ncbi:3',5'-cyclic-AMP phosphodiesterase [Aliikangiella coralliicola]|uniref:3',5'-cyclic-AMP phosphodiesterase n=1 Tax=Aliikangiella coralliicola TaxID=2592383 RepID=A0A545UBZ4_9GAMM|nr:3',5'-cyclic-AMP phosphodiesterase [Aliikangiella coralliicola]TQV86986.1 3',5'-cyclic-AMP phosphodiesterase [Aliikangiella coralliicola]
MSVKVEKIPHEIQPGRLDVVRLVQVTDSHIFADPEGCLLGLNTRDSFEAVCERVQREEWRPDALLATGDLSQDASPESYQYLADYFKEMGIPTYWLSGNHDNPETMELYLSNNKVFSAKQLLIGHWQIILLDSSVRGKVHGNLAVEQLKFLERALKRYPEKHALVSLHHQPLPVGSQWLDQIGLKNSDKFCEVLERYPQVKGVLWGHVHQEFNKHINGCQWIASPSSCVQFKPGSSDFSAGTEAPGYRYLNLFSDGRIESIVHRIDNMEFTVDYSIKGY